MHWFTDPILKQYADFSGRATRREFWMFNLSFFLLLLLTTFIMGFVSTMGSVLSTVTLIVFVIGFLGTIIPALAITVRRLHDIDRSGWWILLNFIPYVGGIIMLVFYCLPSQAGVNRYGANKYGVAASMSPSQPQEVSATETTSPTM